MKFVDFDVVFQEVPNEISLCFSISGCKIQCKDCHSPKLWNVDNGEELTLTKFSEFLIRYEHYATCVLFMGGEWFEEELCLMLQLAKRKGFKTCLYTGLDDVSEVLKSELTWLKVGKWVSALGGLNSPQTNQKFIEVKTNKILNDLFIK